jgi:CRP-like cAMP-binding protein
MKREALRASPVFQSMQPAELDEIISFASERRFPRGAIIFHKGDPGSSIMAVLMGRVRVSSVSMEGKEVTLNVIGPGEIFGEIALLDGKPRSAGAQATEDTTLMVVERKHFLPFLMRHENLVERLLVIMCDRLRRTSLHVEEISLFDLQARLARVLVKLAADYGRPIDRIPAAGVRIDLKISQSELGKLVASSRESVNKQLRIWREEGIIDLDAGFLVIRDLSALQGLFE